MLLLLPLRCLGTPILLALLLFPLLAPGASAQLQTPFEAGPVRPLAMSPNGSRLFAVNTPGQRLEIFNLQGVGVVHRESVPVGLEPVAVAARSDSEVWVVNHASDSISIVDVSTSPARVVRTLLVGDEPRDIVFAGPGGDRAFITAAHRGQNIGFDPQPLVSAIGRADVWVFDANSLGSSLEGDPLAIVSLFGNTPRALSASADGSTVFAAVFRSGNRTTLVAPPAVCDGGELVAPCVVEGATMPGGLPAPNQNIEAVPQPETGLIVKQDTVTGAWLDELGRDWSPAVPVTLPDFDVFSISANGSPPVMLQSQSDVGTILYGMAVNPVSGNLYVSNTEAQNHVRFEPELTGAFNHSRITVLDATGVHPRHLNKHIDYAMSPAPAGVSANSLSLPMGMAVSADGATLYVAAFGSNKVAFLDTALLENDTFVPSAADHVVTAAGPAGLVLDDVRGRLYVLTRIEHGVEVIDVATRQVTQRWPLRDPEPANLRAGRRLLYDATLTSSNGEVSCGTCHVFGDWDGLAWDLGNPDGLVAPNPNPGTENEPPGSFVDFHPLKGPATTQTLRGISTHGPMHWRGDRTGGSQPGGDPMDERQAFHEFNPAFAGLLGRSTQLSFAEMDLFADFVLSLFLMPNPNRALDNSLTPAQDAERQLFETGCASSCHTLDPANGLFGTSRETILLETFGPGLRTKKPASPRFAYQKIGKFNMFPLSALTGTAQPPVGAEIAGFGLGMDGSGAFQEFGLPIFLEVFPTDLAPIVGQQTTLTSATASASGPRVDLFNARAGVAYDSLLLGPSATECEVVARGLVGGEPRGWLRLASGLFQSDRSAEPPISDPALRALATAAGAGLTYTCVAPGSGTLVALDQDGDGVFDGDERDAGTDPINPASFAGVCADGLDNDDDGLTDLADPGCANPAWTLENPACDDGVDNDADGKVDFSDGPCSGSPWRTKETQCGLLGLEVALPLLWRRWRQRRSRAAG